MNRRCIFHIGLPLFLLTALAIGVCAQPINARDLRWTRAAWKPDPASQVAAVKQLEQLKFGPKRDLETVNELIRRHVLPLKDKISRLGVTQAKMDASVYFWPVVLEAYFPSEMARAKVYTKFALEMCQIEPTYLFARAGYVVLTRNGGAPGPHTELATRLLQKNPNDHLVQISFIRMAGSISKFSEAYHGRAVQYAESLMKQLKFRRDLALESLVRAHEYHFLYSFSKASYARCTSTMRRVAGDSEAPAYLREYCNKQIKYYRTIESRIGWKDS